MHSNLAFLGSRAFVTFGLALCSLSITCDVRAQSIDEASTSRDAAPIVAPPAPNLAAPELAATSPADANRARRLRRARRREMAGWPLFTLAAGALLVGAPAAHNRERRATEACIAADPMESRCGFLDGLAPIAVVVFTVPVALIGSVVGGRGTYERRHLLGRNLTLRPSATNTAWGLSVRGMF